MKIIRVDNYSREYIADSLIAENITEYWANRIVEMLNESEKRPRDDWFRAVPDNYTLWRGMEELV